jgi:hypothetical protein
MKRNIYSKPEHPSLKNVMEITYLHLGALLVHNQRWLIMGVISCNGKAELMG